MTIDCKKFFKKTHKCTSIYERNLITQGSPTCFGHSCNHLQGGTNNNTNIVLICRHQSTVKNHTVFVKILLMIKHPRIKKYYNLKIVVWRVGLFNDGHMSEANMSVFIMK